MIGEKWLLYDTWFTQVLENVVIAERPSDNKALIYYKNLEEENAWDWDGNIHENFDEAVASLTPNNVRI